ncbi:Ferroporti-1 [Trinorchestia longiramus]|nr:Ferroporti-1 [Trinorchestia longiramus]
MDFLSLTSPFILGSNSVIRAIDLSTEVLSPAAAGYLMVVLSVSAGAAVVVVWNIVSLALEAVLYARVWQLCPQLHKPKENVQTTPSTGSGVHSPLQWGRQKVGEVWVTWGVYMTHQVRPAGLGLAFLYMTVLAFDNYSRAYLYEAGLNEALLGIFTSVSSLPGLAGSVLFPLLRRLMGVERVGVLGFGWLTASLTLCVASVFAPGSLFYLASTQLPGSPDNESSFLNTTMLADTPLLPSNLSSFHHNVSNRTSSSSQLPADSGEESYCSVALLLTGIIISRYGLWTADLAVVQSMQELVAPQERGALGGVQSALNMFFDLLRSVLLIIWPRVDTFGYLVILSFCFVFMGCVRWCWGVSGVAGVRQVVLGCVRCCWGVSGVAGVRQVVLGCVRWCWGVSGVAGRQRASTAAETPLKEPPSAPPSVA